MNKPSWSFVLIVRNEEKTLPRLLKSLEAFRDRGGEVVVVDTGSKDSTAQLARDWGCKVEEVGDRFLLSVSEEQAKAINEKFCVAGEPDIIKAGDRQFDYASARNYATSLASNDFVWSPDADEIFTCLDLDVVEAAIQSGADILEYEFVFAHDAEGRPTIRFMHSKAFNRRKFQWKGVVHEVLDGTGKRQYIGQDKILLEHFQNHETNRSHYLRGLAIDCYEHPDNDRNSHYLGRELLWTGRPRSAIRELERHVGMNKWPAERSQSAVFIGDAYMMIGDEANALAWWHKAIDIDCSRREPWLKLAEHYYRKGDAQRTAAYANAALTIKQSGFYADNADHYRHVPHEMLYWAFHRLGDIGSAKMHYESAASFNPTSYKSLIDYQFFHELPTVSFVIPTLGRPEGLQKCLDSLKKLNYPQAKIDVCVLEEPEPTVPQKVKMGVEKTSGEYIVYAANDTEFTPDSLLVAIVTSIRMKKRLVAFHSEELLPDKGNICAHFVIKRDLIPEIGGEVFCTRITHCGVDNLLYAKAFKLNEAHHEARAIIAHHHFSKGSEYDWVYQRGWSKREEDLKILAEELAKL